MSGYGACHPGAGAAYYGGFCSPSPNMPPSYGAAGPYPGPVPGMPPGYGHPYGYPQTAGAAYYNGVPTAYYGALYGGNGFGLGASYPLADPISGYGSYGGFMTNGAYVMSNSNGGAMSRPMAPSGPAPVSSVNLAPLGKTV